MIYTPSKAALAACAITLSFATVSVQAGPPMETDDAGVLHQGSWEFMLSVAGAEINDGHEHYVAPELEVGYGFSDTIAGTVFIGRAVIDAPDESSKSDFDKLGFELKWQLYKGENMSVAVAPSYFFPLTSSSTDRHIIEDVNVASLPVIASYATGNWEFNTQLAYESTSSGPNSTFAGFAAGYSLNEDLLLLAEVYNTQVSGEDEDETNWNIGLDWTMPNHIALLLSYGGSLTSDLHHEEELDRAFFVGLRYHTK